ncbi:MAG: DUF2066 domain-containing protein [Rhodospirillaceae bacterium]|nr:DUF2066 domain-containing protein [Rhodospirillaceae bacterium]
MCGPARIALACALVLLLACGTARANAVFTVAHVSVDAEAASAAEARELAIAAGQRAALETLLRRLTVAGTAPPAPPEDSIAAMVAGFAIDRELVSTTRYRASLTVDFDPAAVRRLLRESGIAYAETVSKPVLVVAVQRDPGGILLWEDGNRWRRAWEERAAHGGLVPILLPLGDVIDLGTVDAAQALASDADALTALAALYGTSEVVVAVAGLSGSAAVAKPAAPAVPGADNDDGDAPAAGRALTLSLRRIAAGESRAIQKTLIGRERESEKALLRRGTDRIVTLLEDDWKAANLIRYADQRVLRATVPIASLGEWVSIQQRIAALAMVATVEIDSLSLSEGRLTLRYHGTEDQLRLALGQDDLDLAPEADEWVLRPRAEQPKPMAPDAAASGESE